jgi:hypothetical protein
MKRILTLLFLVLVSAVAANAVTLSDYKQRLDAAAGYLRDLEEFSTSPEVNYQLRKTDLVNRAIPPTETDVWQGGSVETQNAWLGAALNQYLAETDPQKKREIARLARERLESAAASITDLSTAAADRSKDADKQKLGEILTRPEYQPATSPEETTFQRWWREFWEWFDRQFPRPQLLPSSAVGLGSVRAVLQVVLFVVIAGLIGFLLWRFLPYLSARFGGREKRERADRVILGEIISGDESSANIFGEAERLARAGDIRGAIRKGYIAALFELGDRRLVRIARHKTNRDYLRDVRSSPYLHDGLRGMTENFERNWYGIRTAKPEDWEAFRSTYDATLREAKIRS